MSRKSHKGYYIKGEFVAAGSDADQRIRNELQDTNALSRTALKKASERLQEVGEELLAAREDLLAELPLPEELKDAFFDARELTSFGAKRRQTKFIGKLMRRLDAEALDAVRAALRVEYGQAAKDAQILHRARSGAILLSAMTNGWGSGSRSFPAATSSNCAL